MKKYALSTGGDSTAPLIRKFSLKQMLAALIYFTILSLLLPLQYDNMSAKTVIEPIIWTSIAFVAYKLFPRKSELRTGVFLIGGVIYLLFLFSWFTNLTGFCANIDHGVLYVNKKDPSRVLTMKTYECFMTEGDPELFEERSLTDHFKWVTRFNQKPVDTVKWRSIAF